MKQALPMHRLQRFGMLCLTTILLAAGLPPPDAQSTPVISKGFYAEDNFASCTIAYCEIVFTAVPAAKTVIITNVTCLIRTIGAPNIPVAQLYNSQNQQLDVLVPVFLGNYASGGQTLREYAVNHVVTQIVLTGRTPRVAAQTFNSVGTLSFMQCSISGLIR